MPANERMDKVADAAWLRLTARAAMAIFAVIGPLMLREAVVALGKVNDTLVQLDKRIVASGRLSALSAVLDAAPSARALLMGLREGIYADDQQARALLTAAGLDPDEVLR